jgi:hypothetical protein
LAFIAIGVGGSSREQASEPATGWKSSSVREFQFPQRLDAFAALCDQMVTDQPNLGNFAEVVQQLNERAT